MRAVPLSLVAACVFAALPARAAEYHLTISENTVNKSGAVARGMTINGTIPGPTLRWREGEDVTIKVTNRLKEDSSIHWHGMILPFRMDGVPKISFPGIKPGQTFTYRFRVKQAGTYWYHSHSGVQEQSGVYGSIVIEPRKRVHRYDRDIVVVLSDWSDTDAKRILANLKRESDYYNRNKRTLVGLIGELRRGRKNAREVIKDRLEWGQMRMDPTDIADVTGATYTYLINGQSPKQNWTSVFKPGERVRIRFINGSAMTYFDVKIPGLRMTVVQADGQNVQPVKVDEIRIAVAETYDVIVEPKTRVAYTIFARSMDRSGYARATLAIRKGLSAAIPPLGKRPILGMDAMMGHGGHGMSSSGSGSSMPGMDHSKMGHGSPTTPPAGTPKSTTMDHSKMGHGGSTMPRTAAPKSRPIDHSKMGHAGGSAVQSKRPSPTAMDHSKMGHGSSGMKPSGAAKPKQTDMDHSKMGHNMGSDRNGSGGGAKPVSKLQYSQLRALTPNEDTRAPEREIVLRLTGSMERYFWTINGKKFSEAEPIRLRLGERVRFTFINTTMMDHPMHLHGMWMNLVNGAGARFSPKKHTISVGPGETIKADITVDAPGEWAFHCHLLYHMDTGMFRKVVVARSQASAN